MPAPPVIFPVKSVRDGYFSYLEQAFLISSLLWKSNLPANLQGNATFSFGQMTVEGQAVSAIKLDIKLPFVLSPVIKSGFNFRSSLTSIVKSNVYPETAIPVPPSTNPLPIPAEPVWVDTIEKFIYWLGLTLSQGNNAQTSPIADFMTLATIFDATNPCINVRASLPYDATVYASTANLFQAVKQIITALPSSGGGGTGIISMNPNAGDSQRWSDNFFVRSVKG